MTGRVARIQVVSQLHHEVDTADPDQAWTWFVEHGGRTFVPVPGSERLRDVDTAPAGSEVFDVAPGRRQRTYRCDAHWTVDLDLDAPPPWLRSAPSGV